MTLGEDRRRQGTRMDEDDVWWYVCQLCHRAYTKNAGVRDHKRSVHPNSPIGLKNVLILSQLVDLGVRVKVQRWRKSTEAKRTTRLVCNGANGRTKLKVQAQVTVTQNDNVKAAVAVALKSKIPRAMFSKSAEAQILPQPRHIVVKEEVLPLSPQCTVVEADNENGLDWFDQNQDPDPDWENPSPLEEEQPESEPDHVHGDPDPDWLLDNGDADEDDNIDQANINTKNKKSLSGISLVKSKSTSNKLRPKKKRHPRVRKRLPKTNASTKQPKPKPDLNQNGSPDFNCPVCAKVHISNRDLKRHQREVHGDDGDSRDHICSTCGAPFKKGSQLRNHLRTHDPANNKPFICDVCAKAFYTEFLLLRHRAMHEPPTIPCPAEGCGKMFWHSAALKKHNKRIHSEARPYKCDHKGCEKSFKLLAYLRNHSSAHVEGPPVSCRLCSKTFKSQENLRRHVKLVHLKSDGSKFTCSFCGLKCRGRKTLLHHELKVHDVQRCEKLYECRYCDKKFSHKYNMESHEIIHTDERPHVCETCGKSFKTIPSLRQHKTFHLPVEERRHVCNTCGIRFALPDGLRKHQRICNGSGYKGRAKNYGKPRKFKADAGERTSTSKTEGTDSTTAKVSLKSDQDPQREIETRIKTTTDKP